MSKVLGSEKSYKFPAEIMLEGSSFSNFQSQLAAFRGKYFCYASEVKKHSRLDLGTVKALTGDDSINAKELYKNPIVFDATWQIIYAVNDLPAVNGVDFAFEDRLIVIPFMMFFFKDEEKKQKALDLGTPEKFIKAANNSKGFKESLYSEKAGILKWLIDNYNHLNNNLGGVIPESAECKLKKNTYITDNNDIGLFVKENCIIDPSGALGYFSLPEDLAEEYRQFTGQRKRASRGIVDDIIKCHQIIRRDVDRVDVPDDFGNRSKKQARIVRNIILKGKQPLETAPPPGADDAELYIPF
jgi:hypothetical protein